MHNVHEYVDNIYELGGCKGNLSRDLVWLTIQKQTRKAKAIPAHTMKVHERMVAKLH